MIVIAAAGYLLLVWLENHEGPRDESRQFHPTHYRARTGDLPQLVAGR